MGISTFNICPFQVIAKIYNYKKVKISLFFINVSNIPIPIYLMQQLIYTSKTNINTHLLISGKHYIILHQQVLNIQVNII